MPARLHPTLNNASCIECDGNSRCLLLLSDEYNWGAKVEAGGPRTERKWQGEGEDL